MKKEQYTKVVSWRTYDYNFMEMILLFILLEYSFSWFVLYIRGPIKKGVHFYPQNQLFIKALKNGFKRLSTFKNISSSKP